ncbi:MAG: hypothetical protein L0287_16505 [Anaerolineae bacterium]|nr:hypothetical protein [Anaerolineae bacterium]
MDDENKLSGKVGLDTTDFKTNTAGMNRELRVLESGFRASAAALGDWAKDATGLELRINSLNSQMDIQKQKIAATRAEYERIKAESGENSRAAQDLEIKLNKETETLGKMQNELGNTESALEEMKTGSDEAGDSVEETGKKAEEAEGRFEGFKAVIGGIGAVVKGAITVVLGLTGAVVGVTAAIGGLVFWSANASGELVDLNTQTGISTTRLQELRFVGNQLGVSLDTITGAQSRLIRTMAEAKDSNSEQAKAFDTLGVKAVDAAGNLRDSQAVFSQVIDALGRIQNPAERDALAMQLFGKSAQELNGLIKAGSGEMAALTAQAHELGAVMEAEDVAALESFGDLLAALQDGLKGTLGTLATAFLPGFQAVFEQVGGYVKEFSQIVKGADGDFGKIAEGLVGLVQKIATDIAQQAPEMLSAGLAIVQSILTAIIAALPNLLTAATEILTSLINFIAQALPTLLQAGVQILLTLINAIIANLPMLVDAALQAIIALANGLAEALPALIPAVVQAVITIVETLTDNIPLLIEAATQLILGLAQGLITALPILIAAIPTLVDAILGALIESLPQFFEAAGELVGMLATGIQAAIPVLLVATGELIASLINKLAKLLESIPELGKRFVQGLAEGVTNAKGILFDAVTNMINTMIANIESLLGISSPSTVGKGIGKNLIGSIGLGGLEALPSIEKFFANASQRMALAVAGSSSSVQSISTDNSFDIWGNVIIQGDTPAGSLGARLKGKRF